MAGGYLSVFRGTGMEFDEVREFAEGDDPRSVDWNVTARTGRPHVKIFVEERELTVLFLLDLSASLRFGTVRRDGGARVRTVRQAAAEFCACLALAAARNHDKAGLVAFSDRIERYVPPKKGSGHVLRIVREALGLEAAGQGTDLAGALRFAARVQRRRAVVFLVSDFLTPLPALELRRLARRHDLVAVRVQDPATRTLPRAGLLRVRDLETGAYAWVDTDSARVRAAHAAEWAARDAAHQETLARAGVDAIEVRTDRGVAEPILRFFQMRELRGARR
ncbi:MAG: DUF58 domain-containing protein [Planctomycetes bacterium]|nr:DUF58 domain-containing protein [Planctomycetota bacterium]